MVVSGLIQCAVCKNALMMAVSGFLRHRCEAGSGHMSHDVVPHNPHYEGGRPRPILVQVHNPDPDGPQLDLVDP